MTIFISERDACRFLNLKKETLRKHCNQGKYNHKFTKKGNKRYYRIDLFSLPENIQKQFFDELEEKHTAKPEVITEEVALEYLGSPAWKRKKADKYKQILLRSKHLKGNDLKAFIDEWNYENPDQKTSYCRVLEARKIQRKEGSNGLLAKYDSIKRAEAPIKQEDFDTFKSMYMTQNKPSAQSCWYYVKEFAKIRNEDISNFPVCKTFLRRLRKEIPKDSIYLARYGKAAWNSKYGKYIERDYSNLEAGAMWVSDHSQIDVACTYEGKVVFPWVTVWRDMKTSKWLAWNFHAEYPNSDHIFKTFYMAAEKFGIPETIYMDNGKDYRTKDFAGGKKRENKANLFESNISNLTETRTNAISIKLVTEALILPKDLKNLKKRLSKTSF